MGTAYIVIIVLCHAIVFKEIRRHEQQIAAQQDSTKARQNFLKKNEPLNLLLLCVFLFCYLPKISFTGARNALKSRLSIDVIYAGFFATICLITVNSIINPLIYCAKQRQFRDAVIELLFRKNFSEANEFEKKIFTSSRAVASQEWQQERGHNQREDIQGGERGEQHEDNKEGERGEQHEDNKERERGEQHEDNQGGEREEQHEDTPEGGQEQQLENNKGGEQEEHHEHIQGGIERSK